MHRLRKEKRALASFYHIYKSVHLSIDLELQKHESYVSYEMKAEIWNVEKPSVRGLVKNN